MRDLGRDSRPPGDGKAAPKTTRAAVGGGTSSGTISRRSPGISASGVQKLRNARCQDCNGPTVEAAKALQIDAALVFVIAHMSTCPYWHRQTGRHGVGIADVVLHTLGVLSADRGIEVMLGETGDVRSVVV